jgi:tetratricopeptide (TPR) repeat protein
MKPFSIALADIDKTQLPQGDQSKTGEELELAILKHFSLELAQSGEQLFIHIDEGILHVEPLPTEKDAIQYFAEGKTELGLKLCDQLLEVDPENINILFNSGMALSDLGKFKPALDRLNKAFYYKASSNIATAIGVAHQRSGDRLQAITWLEKALALDANNIYATRNLCALLMGNKEFKKVITLLKDLVKENPLDQNALFLYGSALFEEGNKAEADHVLKAVVDLAPYNELATKAKSTRGKIAEMGFVNSKANSNLRPDAVVYLREAIKLYSQKTNEEQLLLFKEVAVVGMKGLSTNDATPKYTLKNLPLKKFTGLNMVCLMVEGAKRFSPEIDLGFDLSEEYAEALRLSST